MECPRCHLENPPSAEYCECGYSFVTKSVAHCVSTALPREANTVLRSRRYPAHEKISGGFRALEWIFAAGFVISGIVAVVSSTDQAKPITLAAAIGAAIMAAVLGLVLPSIGEGIVLFVDIACDVRTIASG